MAAAEARVEMDKAYRAALPRKAIEPQKLLNLVGQSLAKATADDTDPADARDITVRALALAESMTGELEKSDGDGEIGEVTVDAAVLADVEKDAAGFTGGGLPMSAMLEKLEKQLGEAPAPAPVSKSDDAADDSDNDLYSMDLNDDPTFGMTADELAKAEAADDE